jgi:hypothetical protein
MAEFQSRFGQKDADGPGYHFSNVRSGLIVALVRTTFLSPRKKFDIISYLSER